MRLVVKSPARETRGRLPRPTTGRCFAIGSRQGDEQREQAVEPVCPITLEGDGDG